MQYARPQSYIDKSQNKTPLKWWNYEVKQRMNCLHRQVTKPFLVDEDDGCTYVKCMFCHTFICNTNENAPCSHDLTSYHIQTNDGYSVQKCTKCNILIAYPINQTFGATVEHRGQAEELIDYNQQSTDFL